jgi:tripartite-type tricarboxylate transporter receptor subunit TctC
MSTGIDSSTGSLDYPSKRVCLVEPIGAGGGPDLVGRALADALSELWRQPVQVENHSGGGSTAAPSLVANAPADGYILLVHTSAHAYSAAAATGLPYDPLCDFIPVAALTSQPYVLVSGHRTGIGSLGDLIERAKAHPGELTFATTGIGTGTHVGIMELNLAAGISATHLPPSSGESIRDVVAKAVSGATHYVMSPISIAAAHIKDARLVPLGVTTTRRSPLLADVGTIDEAGVPGYDFPIWYGLWAPAATPQTIVDRLAAGVSTSLARADLRDRLAHEGAEPIESTQPEFSRLVLAESHRAAQIMDRARRRPRLVRTRAPAAE